MVGRNDPCPCGSGKKYKKCHGKEQVVDMQAVVDAEIEQIMAGFAEEGLDHKEYNELEMRLRKWDNALSHIFDKDMIETAAFETYIYIDRKDLWQSYINRQQKKQKRRQVSDVLEAWKHPFLLMAEIMEEKEGILTLKDGVDGKPFKLQATDQSQKGDWLFGVMMNDPREGDNGLQATGSVIFIPKSQKGLVKALIKELKSFKGDSLGLYRLFGNLGQELELPHFESQALDLIVRFVREFQIDATILEPMAKALLLNVPTKAKKPEALAAGILQAANEFGFFGSHYMTQSAVAKHFGVSAGTLSKYRHVMSEYLMEMVDTAQKEMTDIPDAFSETVTEMGTDPRGTERAMWGMVKRAEQLDFQSVEDLNRRLEKEMNSEYKPVDDEERAQKLCYDAYETTDEKQRFRLAKTALEFDPKNTDVHLLMAEHELDIPQKQLHYLQAINTGYRKFDPDYDDAWNYVMNRPLLRALFAYGSWLMTQGKYKEAIEQFEDILGRNPSDHQGAKWLLTSAYIRAEKWDKADDFLMEFDVYEDETLNHYFDCIMDIHDGDIDEEYIREAKEEGRRLNPRVAKFLKEGKNPGAFPRQLLLEPGNEDEARLVYWLIYGLPGTELLI